MRETVADFARVLDLPASTVASHMKDAGVVIDGPDSEITVDDKLRLLSHIRNGGIKSKSRRDREETKSYLKKRYMDVRGKAREELRRIILDEMDGAFSPCQCWWPTPYEFFSNKYGMRNNPKMIFRYSGGDERLIRLNKEVSQAWEEYFNFCEGM